MKPIILFRADNLNYDELEIARQYMPVVVRRCSEEMKNRLVIGRYSVLPYYSELESDLQYFDSRLINSHAQHRWIANFEYYDFLKDFTFPTWDEKTIYQCKHDGPFVVKGRTNSKKHYWNTSMYAETKMDAIKLGVQLQQDPLISTQGLLYRKYTPLKTFEVGINGVRFTNEWRFFVMRDEEVCHAYYWSEAEDVESPRIDEAGRAFVKQIIEKISYHEDPPEFYVLDVAEKEEGGWVLVEVNDGQMSGLSMNDPHEFYSNIARILR